MLQKLGNSGDRTIELRRGLALRIREAFLWQTIRIETPHDQSILLISKFHLSGNSRVLTPNVADVKKEWYAHELIQVVMVLINPESLKEFDTGDNLESNQLQLIQRSWRSNTIAQSLTGLTQQQFRLKK